MPKLTVDNQPVEVAAGQTVLDAARKLGMDIPTLCLLQGRQPCTSCMVCLVKLLPQGRLVPSCATVAEEGMQVESQTDDVFDARRNSLELLLSDHLGDCMGPCHLICPAGMNIPRMIRQIAAGQLADAIVTVKQDIALPAVLGRICLAPCEKGCRRGKNDGPVAICLLKRFAADVDLAAAAPYLPACAAATGNEVAIVGAGPAGLSAAWYLRQCGHACTVFDEHAAAGGALRTDVDEARLPRPVLDAEIAVIAKLGVSFRFGTRIGRGVSLEELRQQFDAVVLAVGSVTPQAAEALGVRPSAVGVEIDRKTFQTRTTGVFAIGNAVRRPQKMAVRAGADGKTAAVAVHQLLAGQPVVGPHEPFNVHIGPLKEGEMDRFLALASPRERIAPTAAGSVSGDPVAFTPEQAVAESPRCLHCDCRKADDCRLRDYSDLCRAAPNRFHAERRAFEHDLSHPRVIYEPGKCIACGLCVQIAADAGEKIGLTFLGRGFGVRVAVPFGLTLAEALTVSADDCVRACPTGALAFKDT